MINKFMYYVSPDYLRALYRESKSYSFKMKGYCSIEEGLKNLKFTNISDVLGFAIVLHEFPEELAPLINLINNINRVGKGKTLVLCSFYSDGLDLVLEHVDTSNLKFYVYTDLIDFTDVDIKRNIIGTILLNEIKPYKEDNHRDSIKIERSLDLPKYIPILPENISWLYEPLIPATDYKRCIDVDPVILKAKSRDLIIYMLRCEMVYVKYDVKIDNYNRFLELIKDQSIKDQLLYKSVWNIIHKG